MICLGIIRNFIYSNIEELYIDLQVSVYMYPLSFFLSLFIFLLFFSFFLFSLFFGKVHASRKLGFFCHSVPNFTAGPSGKVGKVREPFIVWVGFVQGLRRERDQPSLRIFERQKHKDKANPAVSCLLLVRSTILTP